MAHYSSPSNPNIASESWSSRPGMISTFWAGTRPIWHLENTERPLYRTCPLIFGLTSTRGCKKQVKLKTEESLMFLWRETGRRAVLYGEKVDTIREIIISFPQDPYELILYFVRLRSPTTFLKQKG